VNAFVTMAIKEMKAAHGTPREKIATGTTYNRNDYLSDECPATKTYSQWERVAYVQLPRAVAYLVLSSRDEKNYRKDSGALQEVRKALIYLEQKKDKAENNH